MRARASLSNTTLIAITALHRAEVVANALKAGAVACLAKPFAVEQVIALARGNRTIAGAIASARVGKAKRKARATAP